MNESICEKCANNSTCEVADTLFGSRLTITRCRNFVAGEDGGADDGT